MRLITSWNYNVSTLKSLSPSICQVTFHYVGYNESGRRIDSTYLQGAPAKIRMGTKALVPGNVTMINKLECFFFFNTKEDGSNCENLE